MSKITASTDFSQVKPEDLARYVEMFCKDVTERVNGNLDFATNFSAQEVSVSFSQINADTVVSHTLGRAAQSYLITSKSAACDIYNGSAASQNSLILKSTVAPVTVTLVVY